MSGSPLYDARFVSGGAREIVGALGAFSLIGAVGAGVAVFQGAYETLPALLWGSLVVFVVFGAAAFWAQRSAARRVVVSRDETLRLCVEGPRGVEIALEAPFDVEAAWYVGEIATGRGSMSHPVLLLVLRDRGRPVLLLEESLGALHSPPSGWRQGGVQGAGARRLVNSIGRVHLDRLRDLLQRS